MSRFSLAEGYVELSQKGFGPVSSAIDAITGKLKAVEKTNLGALDGALEGVTGHIRGMLSPMSLLSQALAGIGAGVGVGGMIGMAMDAEKTRIGFDQLTRSAEVTDGLLKSLKKQFVGTGISGEEYKAAAKEMLQLGVSAADIPAKLNALGNISAATGEPLSAMANAMRRAELTGKVTSRTIMMMDPAIQDMLVKMYPATGGVEGLMRAAENGEVGITQLQAAIQNLGGETGEYANALAANQASMSGQWDILKGNVAKAATDIGDWIIRAFDLNDVTANLSDWVGWFLDQYGDTILESFYSIRDTAMEVWGFIEDNKAVIGIIAEVVAGFLAVKLAATGISIAMSLLGPGISLVSTLFGVCTTVVGLLGDALMFLFANPIGLTILALAALAAAVYGVLRYFGMSGPIDDFANRVIASVKKATGAVLGMAPNMSMPGAGQHTADAIAKAQAEAAARAQKRTEGAGSRAQLTQRERTERNKWVAGGAPALNAPALGPGKKSGIEAGFSGIAELAGKMQDAAFKNIAEEHLDVAKNQEGHLQALAGCVQNGALAVAPQGNAPAQHWGA